MSVLIAAAAVCVVQLPPVPEFISIPDPLTCIERNIDTGECLSWQLRRRDRDILDDRDAQMLRYIEQLHAIARHGKAGR